MANFRVPLRTAAFFLCFCISFCETPVPRFREQTIAKDLKYGYQLAAVDLNGDGRKDLIAVDEAAGELAWYENPGWQRHLITGGVGRMINLDCWDVDGDGVPEILLAHRFDTRPAKSLGILLLLHHEGDVRGPWSAREIDRIPTAHRVRWADIDGNGKKALLAAPMIGAASEAPEYKDQVPIYIYRPGEWKRELLSNDLRGILHSIYPYDWDGDGRQELLTASFLGIHLFRRDTAGRWGAQRLAQGDARPCPLCGSSEIVVGRLGGRRMLVAIEPWHGNQVVVYRQRGGAWQRQVLDDTLINGHALAVGDLDGDGRDEIVAGFRGKGYQIYLYKAEDRVGARWRRTVLDAGGIAAADCKIADFTGDGRPDIACIGAATGNVKLYQNLGGR